MYDKKLTIYFVYTRNIMLNLVMYSNSLLNIFLLHLWRSDLGTVFNNFPDFIYIIYITLNKDSVDTGSRTKKSALESLDQNTMGGSLTFLVINRHWMFVSLFCSYKGYIPIEK